MPIGTWTFGYQIRQPRHIRGVDFGVAPLVLYRAGEREVWWLTGHTSWVCIGSQGYYESHLLLAGDPKDHGIGERVFEGGRLSVARIREHAGRIEKHLGVPSGSLPDYKRGVTWIWNPESK